MGVKAAIIQKPPVLLDRAATIERALASIEEAVGQGASLLVFPEAYVPGYPMWIWRLKPAGDMALTGEIHARLRQNAVDLGGSDLQPVQDAAARHGVTVVMGINEIDSAFSGTTLFNTVVVIGPKGEILNRHRKLMPTNPERMVWGTGDGQGLRVVDTAVGRVGTLICWENYMPLARYALYAQNIDIYVAPTWDSGPTWLATMQHIAREGGVWTIGCATALEASDVPTDLPYREELFPDAGEWVNPGDAVVHEPFGGMAAGPMHAEKGMLSAEIDVVAARASRRKFDVAGHYARPDIFTLNVNRAPQRPVTFSGGSSPAA